LRRKLHCTIYTYKKKHRNVQASSEAWGWRGDGFFAASTKTVERLKSGIKSKCFFSSVEKAILDQTASCDTVQELLSAKIMHMKVTRKKK
jgi:hypothetical protein